MFKKIGAIILFFLITFSPWRSFPSEKEELNSAFALHFVADGIELKEVKVQSKSGKGNFKDIEDKLGQLVCEVRKLPEQLVNISSQANGTFAQSTTHM